MINKSNVCIEISKFNIQKADCWINCFERMLTILFKEVGYLDIGKIEDIMEDKYYEWNEDDKGMCCEEYIIDNLPNEYKEKIVAVIYDNEDGDFNDEEEDF